MKLEHVHCRVTALATSSPHVAFDISELGWLGSISSPTVRLVPFSCGWNTRRQNLSAVDSVNSAPTKGLILMTNGSKTWHFSVRCLKEMGWSELETLMGSDNPPRQQQWPSPALKLPFVVLSTGSGSSPHQLFVLLLEAPCTVATCEQNKMLIIIKFPLLCVRSEKVSFLCLIKWAFQYNYEKLNIQFLITKGGDVQLLGTKLLLMLQLVDEHVQVAPSLLPVNLCLTCSKVRTWHPAAYSRLV